MVIFLADFSCYPKYCIWFCCFLRNLQQAPPKVQAVFMIIFTFGVNLFYYPSLAFNVELLVPNPNTFPRGTT